MKQVWASVFAILVLAATTNTADAFGRRNSDCCAPPPCEVKITYVDKVITCYKTQLVEREVKCIVNKVVCKTIEVEQKVCVMQQEWREEKRTVVVCKMVPREVEREVTYCRYVSETVKDPCTGCMVTRCKPVTETKKVKTIICEPVRETREEVVKVCCYKPVEKVVKVNRIVAECQPVEMTRKVFDCVKVPYQVTIKVPVCEKVCCK